MRSRTARLRLRLRCLALELTHNAEIELLEKPWGMSGTRLSQLPKAIASLKRAKRKTKPFTNVRTKGSKGHGKKKP